MNQLIILNYYAIATLAKVINNFIDISILGEAFFAVVQFFLYTSDFVITQIQLRWYDETRRM